MMNKALVYKTYRTFINGLKTMKDKPFQSLIGLLGLIWLAIFPISFKGIVMRFNINNPESFMIVYTIFALYLGLPSLLTYLRRKGIVFEKSDVNLVFQAPIDPKEIIIYGLYKNILIDFLFQVAIMISAYYAFNVSGKRTILLGLYLLISSRYDKYLISSLYGGENLSERLKDYMKYLVYTILIVISAIVLFRVVEGGFNIKNGLEILNSNIILAVPVIGWEIGLIRLIILGPSSFNILVSLVYLLFFIGLYLYDRNTSLRGEFFESASSYADEVSKMKEASKSGVSISIKEKDKDKEKDYGESRSIRGRKASAIFYKQIEERNKLGLRKRLKPYLLIIVLSIVTAVLGSMYREKIGKDIYAISFVFYFYYGLISSSFSLAIKEFSNHYIYLFPDTMFKKLIYSNLLDFLMLALKGIIMSFTILYIGLKAGLTIAFLAFLLLIAFTTQLNLSRIFIEMKYPGGENVVAKQMLNFVSYMAIALVYFGGGFLGDKVLGEPGSFLVSTSISFIICLILILLGSSYINNIETSN